jgi:hypothetical protein
MESGEVKRFGDFIADLFGVPGREKKARIK